MCPPAAVASLAPFTSRERGKRAPDSMTEQKEQKVEKEDKGKKGEKRKECTHSFLAQFQRI